ncbi:UBA/TS-N domain protein [Penicillium brasilianum]|uniref:Actin cytoskeleton-regulatory complex protein END3 n=1 Tax=Penicillium brasilianum TaxID=104259 RepID=A0A1S9S1H9_PENBI|nr:UBA/TS-N domain protein [Penicillium brasilianum]
MYQIAQRHPNLNLTAEEKRVFYQLFQAADTTNLGVITGEIAVPFFEKTHLPSGTLGEIWQLADKENRGLLTPSGFGIVLRLIGHAQAGRTPSDELALQPGPLPRFEGIVVDNTPAPAESGAASPPPGAGPPIRVPPLQPEDALKFLSLFEKSDISNGMISGEIAKQIFERARLPNEVLGRIWNLADTKQRGALDATDFIIAMHLLTSFKSGALRGIPQTLPPGLYEAAARRGSGRGSFGARPDVPPVPSIPKQFTGPQRTSTPMSPNHTGRPAFGGPLSAQSTGDWLISPQEKTHFDAIFETVDTAKLGLITGDQAVGFFMKAQLPEEVLAQIWDLADIDADGQLSRDEFAVAMYLVRLQRGGKEPLPQVLPPALIPPSMRRQAPLPSVAPAPVPAPAPAPIPRSAADDLFGLDSPVPPVAQTQFPQSTGGSNAAFHTPGSPASRATPPVTSTTFKPFIPTSTFGQTLQPQVTGASAGTPVIRSPPPPSDDLLGDNDPEESKKLTQETSDLANLSNQIGSLAKEMHTVQEKRTSAEQSISQTSQQKRDFEARLAQARAMYEQEVANFKALEERLRVSKAETTKLQQEYALIEGGRQDLQNQYTQVSTALAADQQENASLKEKIRQANAEVAQLKPALEKARSNARQQKGLVAINKKQLATVEGERDKIQGEIDTLAQETPQYTETATPVSSAAEVASPAVSTASQNTNPFFRRTATGSSSERALSPDGPTDQQKAFDNLFGQTFAAPSAAGPPPTSFRAESPLASSKSPVTSNVPTPSASPVPAVSVPGAFPGIASEIPPLSQSRQMTPNFLPFGDSQSVTSSTMVSPPASRFGGPDASDMATPQEASEQGGPPSVAASSDYSKTSTPAFEGTPARSPFDEVPAAPEAAIAAAAVEQPPSAISPTSTGNQEPAKDLSFDELFGSKAHKRSESQNQNDFDEAFATMKQQTGEKTNGATAAASSSEFPPIQELHHDEEEDESSDDEGPLGFDDNFTPVSPTTAKKGKQADSIDAAQLAAFPAPGSAQPPSADAQVSPPQYEASAAGDASHMPPEFNGLLPERADPTVAPDAPHSVESSTGAPVIANKSQRDLGPEAAAPVMTGGAKTGGPDFDAAFAGLNLAPAKEADDEDEDDEHDEGHDNKNTTDFDFSFDSPSQGKPDASSSADAGQGTSADFFSFDNNVQAATAQPTASPNGGDSKADDHDWDALFASAKPAAEETAHGASSKSPGWALNNDSGEDDLILQRLTGMGFPRDDSLAALEKFDYNLDKAADYLTSKS